MNRILNVQAVVITGLCVFTWRVLSALPLPYLPGGMFSAHAAFQPRTGFGGLTPILPSSLSLLALGTSPILNAIFIVWLVMTVSRDARRALAGKERYWTVVALVALVLSYLGALGRNGIITDALGTTRLEGAQFGLVSGMIAGTMLVLVLGLVIDRFGVPQGYGVWFMLGIAYLARGSEQVLRALDRPGPHDQTVAVYAILTGLLLLVSIAVFQARLPIILLPSKAAPGDLKQRRLLISLLPAGVIWPILAAYAVISVPPMVLLVSGVSPGSAVGRMFFSDGAGADGFTAYLVVMAALIAGGAWFFTRLAIDVEARAAELFESGFVLRGANTSSSMAARIRRSLRFATIVGGLWMWLMAVAIPHAGEAVLGKGSGFAIGGSSFVIGAGILFEAIRRGLTQFELIPPATRRTWDRGIELAPTE